MLIRILIILMSEPLLRHLYSNFDEMSDKEKDNVLEKEALKYQDIITNDYDRLAKDCFNVNLLID